MKRFILFTISFASLISSALRADVSAAQAARAEHWFQQYAQNRQPDYFLSAVLTMSDEGFFKRAGQPQTSIGFFATVFAQNPQKVEFWLNHISSLPPAHQRILAAAAWQAGFSAGEKMLHEMSEGTDISTRKEIASYLEQGAKSIAQTPVQSESAMYLNWGAFLADGDESHVVAVLNAFGSGEPSLSASARYILAQSAASNERVMKICQAQLEKQPAPLREELRAALNAPVPQSNGT